MSSQDNTTQTSQNKADNEINSKAILAAVRSSINNRGVVDVEEEQVKLVIFRAGGNLYASYGSDVREILPSREIYPVPFLPEYLPGLINVRGDIESALDICFFLGGKRDVQDRVLIMMVKREGFSSGIIVDNIEDVVDIPLSAVKPALSTLSGAAKELISGTIEFSDMTVALLDIEKLASKVSV
ncbi:MAG: chemotaxis protein CheW [Desulfamplus sp.]|nr:chemotaxis protein CheW [Desulfamplus sp.]MBF0413997.1 chemotaxis protein CheW [Desulfamplus sp.]